MSEGRPPVVPVENRLLRIIAWTILGALAIGLVFGALDALARPRAIPAGTRFACTPIAVWDGDGPIWCAEGPRLRLANGNARELDDSCRRGARCVAMPGRAARDALVATLGEPRGQLRTGHIRVVGPPVACRSSGPDRYGRTLATCRNAAGDIGAQLIRVGALAAQ